MNKKPQVGDRVRNNRDFLGVPRGSEGVIDEDYGSGVTVAWDLPDRPLPKDWHFDQNNPTTWANNPENPLRDGFSVEELWFLDLVE